MTHWTKRIKESLERLEDEMAAAAVAQEGEPDMAREMLQDRDRDRTGADREHPGMVPHPAAAK